MREHIVRSNPSDIFGFEVYLVDIDRSAMFTKLCHLIKNKRITKKRIHRKLQNGSVNKIRIEKLSQFTLEF